MTNKVYANNMEVSCKQAAGKSICAFPDVCFTPPLTPATPPGVPIPYPNTGMASDTSNGSTSVKISGQETMLKNKSYFKRSMGDEAGSAPKKGVATSTQMGKVYFTMWSMDVKFEGENVVRMMDMTTHNHASMPSNTPPWAYTDTVAMQVNNVKDPCQKVRDKAEKKCQAHFDNNVYKPPAARAGEVNVSGLNSDMCGDEECKDAMECVMAPFEYGCCDGKTPHHVIPAHCFMPAGERGAGGDDRYSGCAKYDDAMAPCVCVHGKDKSNPRKEHARIHKHFDAIEDSHMPDAENDSTTPGTWTYNQAATAGAESVSKVKKDCDEDCTRAQLNKYHNKECGITPGTELRAQSSCNQYSKPAPLKVVKAK